MSDKPKCPNCKMPMALKESLTREWQMAVSLRDMLRHLMGGDRKPESAFKSEKEAYDFCRQVYNESGGVAPELRRAYEFYQKNYDDGCDPTLSLDVR